MLMTILIIILLIVVFALTVAKMIKNNFTEYIFILTTEFIGIVVSFIAIILGNNLPIWLSIIIVILCILIPLGILALERKNIFPSEFIFYFPWKANINQDTILEVLDKHPKSYIAHQKLYEHYLKSAEKDKAINELYILVDLKPKEYENYCELAELLYENGKSDKSIQILKNLLKEKPDYTNASKLLGNILFENDKYKEAILVYNEALKYNPKEYELYYFLGMTYTRLNDFSNAKENYKKAAAINSLKDISILSIGQIYLIFEEYDKAENYFYKSLDSDDDFILSKAYYNLAKIKLIQGEETRAIQYANLALEYNPKLIKKMEQDELFMKIISKLSLKNKTRLKTKVRKVEIETVEHLDKTVNVVETLTNNYRKNENNIEREID